LRIDYESLDVTKETRQLAQECIGNLREIWDNVDSLIFRNQVKVLDAFVDCNISSTHLWPSTGYGYQDTGREGLESLFANIFGAEAALVRLAWTSGTHVLKTVLFGLLRPGDDLLSITGVPYETLRPVIGISDSQEVEPGSLRDFGINYKESPCLIHYEMGSIDEQTLEREIEKNISE
jgi:cystathionine beta-lyase family protein involved in aluminum resistance